jgi:NAD(P)-dependent dehydrogenase (short-subunit alcohol dehydrogenase family)
MGQADDNVTGVLSNNKRSHDTTPEEFDHINSINYRGCWLSSRATIKQMLTQEPLPTHDGRPGVRGSVVNIASQLGVVGRPAARKSYYQRRKTTGLPATKP